jgi:hypothetical protein
MCRMRNAIVPNHTLHLPDLPQLHTGPEWQHTSSCLLSWRSCFRGDIAARRQGRR